MTTTCRFSTCHWSGSVDEIFTHCETYHARCIREHKGLNYYDFTLDDLTREAFLLCGKDGLYWFSLDLRDEVVHDVKQLKRGVFHIGDSEPIGYTLKMGLIRDGFAEYFGPHTSRPEAANLTLDTYDVEMCYTFIELLNEAAPSRQMRLYVGEFDDSDDRYSPSSSDCTWTEADEELNKVYIERFTCPICFEFMRSDVRFCERMHFVCRSCFEKMVKQAEAGDKLQCPTCRGDYTSEYTDARYDHMLKMVKLPQEDEPDRIEDELQPSSSSKRFRSS